MNFKNTPTRIKILALAVVSMSGCVPTKLTNDLARLDDSVGDLRRFQAEQTTRISAIENQIRQLSGRVDELEYAQNKRLGSDLSSLKQDLTDLKKRVPPPAIVPAATLEEDEQNAGNLPTELAKQFEEGLTKVRSGNFPIAKSLFEELRSLSDGTEYAALMYFWLGVCNEGLGDNRAALETYINQVSKFPKNPRTATALLRQSSLLIRMRDSKSAKITLKKLEADFPKSEEAKRAKERLKELK